MVVVKMKKVMSRKPRSTMGVKSTRVECLLHFVLRFFPVVDGWVISAITVVSNEMLLCVHSITGIKGQKKNPAGWGRVS
jgi:hypothetical protein